MRRGIRLGKFARINLAKRGGSLSLGVRGLRVNIGAKGTRSTVGIPGTGFAYSSYTAHSSGTDHMAASRQANTAMPGCVFAFGTFILFAILFAAMVKSGLDSGISLLVAFVVGTLVTGIYISASMRSAAKAKARALSEAKAAAERSHAEEAERQLRWEAAAAEHKRQQELEQAEEQRRIREEEAQQAAAASKRFVDLSTRFGSETAIRIVNRRLWVGCTAEMLVAMLGTPVAVDEKVLKTKVKRTYKYQPVGANRYALRVFLDNDVVIGWEDKND